MACPGWLGAHHREIFLILSPLYYQLFLRPLHLHLQIYTIVILVKISITNFSPTVVDSIGSTLGEELGLTDDELLGILLGVLRGHSTEFNSPFEIYEINIM